MVAVDDDEVAADEEQDEFAGEGAVAQRLGGGCG